MHNSANGYIYIYIYIYPFTKTAPDGIIALEAEDKNVMEQFEESNKLVHPEKIQTAITNKRHSDLTNIDLNVDTQTKTLLRSF